MDYYKRLLAVEIEIPYDTKENIYQILRRATDKFNIFLYTQALKWSTRNIQYFEISSSPPHVCTIN